MAEFFVAKESKTTRKRADKLKTLFEKKRYIFGKKSFSIMAPKESVTEILFKRDPISKA